MNNTILREDTLQLLYEQIKRLERKVEKLEKKWKKATKKGYFRS